MSEKITPEMQAAYDARLKEIDTMARTIWGEARGESRDGKEAVACVILNRARLPGWWGRTIIEVCTKPFQFSCWLPNDPNRVKLLAVTENDDVFKECLAIARSAASGVLEDKTRGATHYYEKHMPKPPVWVDKLTKTVEIGNHIFYR